MEPCGPDSLCYDFPSSLLLLTPAAMALEQLHLRSGCWRWPWQDNKYYYVELTSLVLDTVRITSQDLERFLYSCHKLQRLELNYCDDLVYVKMPPRPRQRGFKFLALRHCRSVKTVDVSDSGVASLTFDTINRGPSILGSTVAPAPNVTRASFHILANPVAPAAAGVFETTSLARLMPGLESLSLRVTMLVKVVTSPASTWKYRHLKRLDLWMILDGKSRQRNDFIFLHRFLDAAPALESLSLHLMSSAPAFDASRMPPGDVEKRLHLSLKTVTITGFDAHLASLELLLYILENARPLERLSLDPAWYDVDSQMPQMMPPDVTRQRARKAITRHIAPRISQHVALQVL
ncbi:unnamed protein product [Triticum turgidum subsp. durum]|uniref:At1g61320/AtMIF1 LRR domain-containing protein n=1 Tax=Triticum turgidum subsp. durum TaxID=4567 RepID=A0A9R0VC04_TRITD|nr:unnamed protein product [Triticum turgidum subsp. durum]